MVVIRIVLGAERRGVIRSVMRGAMLQAAAGRAIGIPVAILRTVPQGAAL